MSNQTVKRAFAQDIAMRFLGTFYTWGGDDPSGMDCSGFVNEVLQSVGVLPRKGDWTAQDLYDKFPKVDIARSGCLVFWFNNDKTKIIHVEYCITDDLSIGASGGGSNTLTKEDAIKQNAFIKVRPFNSRPNRATFFVDPFLTI
jgi:cell wall-associated NlpC family hydrolase